MLEGAGHEYDGEQDSGNGTGDVRFMIDDAALPLALVHTVGQEQESEDDGRNSDGDEKQVDALEWIEQDE